MTGLSHPVAQATSRRIPPLHAEGLGVPQIIRNVAWKTQVVFGLEANVVFGSETTISFDFRGGTIRQLADQLAALLPGASWREIDGAGIVIFRDSKASELAKTQITFWGANKATLRQTWEMLTAEPELKALMRDKGCKEMNLFRGHEWEGDTPIITIPAGNPTLEHVAALAASKSGRFYWSILDNLREGQCEVSVAVW
jgi:hypothetical protein